LSWREDEMFFAAALAGGAEGLIIDNPKQPTSALRRP
jgi:hypothetical protein